MASFDALAFDVESFSVDSFDIDGGYSGGSFGGQSMYNIERQREKRRKDRLAVLREQIRKMNRWR